MKSHELAQLLLSLPDMNIGIIHYDSEFDYKWVNLVDGIETNKVKVDGEKILVLSESSTYTQYKQFNPNDDFDLLEIEFLLDEDKNILWQVNEDCLTDQLYALFQGKQKYGQYHIPEDTLVKLTLGYDNDTWEPISITTSIEGAKEFILQHFNLTIEDDEWYWLETKDEQ
jgi:hypothetical protein